MADSDSPEPPQSTSRRTEHLVTALVVGIVLLIALFSSRSPDVDPSKSNAPAESGVPPTNGVPVLAPDLIPLVSGDEPIAVIFTKAGCPVCHSIPGIPGADGRVGPPLIMGTTGLQRLADPAYRGHAKTVHAYVIESVMEPGLYVVPNYPDRTMPTWYGTKLSATALEKIAAYLEQQTDETKKGGER